MTNFADKWAEWSGECVNANITPEGRMALRCAFYCGAVAFVHLQRSIATDGDMSQDVRRAMYDSVLQELKLFTDDLIVQATMRHAGPNQ